MRIIPALALVSFVLACPTEPAKPAVTDAGPPKVVDAGVVVVAPPPGPVLPEPPGISAGGHKLPEAPKGKGTWSIDPTATTGSFTIVSNSAGVITGKLAGAAAGGFDAKAKKGPKGVVTVDLTKLVSTNKDGVGNPARDTNVIEAFFGARPFANADKKPAVEDAWKKLAGKLAGGVAQAGLVIDGVEGGAADVKDKKTADGVVNGKLVLWDSVEIPVSWPVKAERKGDVITVTGGAPAQFDIEKVTGSAIRKALFDNLLAAGCAHQPGIKNEVTVSLDQVTLKLNKK